MAEARIWVAFTHPRLHRWPEAPRTRQYLAALHRHLFHVRVSTTVLHDDRELEFHDLLDEARDSFIRQTDTAMSCEAMARELAESMCRRYDRAFTVEVSEDGECGAVVEAKKKAPAVKPRPWSIRDWIPQA
jgi:hypothetical protein